MKSVVSFIVLLPLFYGCTLRTVGLKVSDTEQPLFDMRTFDQKCALAHELVKDDRAAWITTDSIMAEKPILLDSLDKTWFVDIRDGKRYVFYGRYSPNNDEYYPKYAFIAEENGSIRRITPRADDRARMFARAVFTAVLFFESISDSIGLDVQYNHFIRRRSDGSFELWFFPAGYGNYCAHGLDIYLTVDSSGREVVYSGITGKYIRYFEIDNKEQTIELDNTYDSSPSLGNIFFAISNRVRFRSIAIINSHSTSRMVYSPQTGDWVWVHTKKSP